MSWYGQHWKYVDGKRTTIPLNQDYLEYDWNEVYYLFTTDNNTTTGYPRTAKLEKFKLKDVYSGWYIEVPEAQGILEPVEVPYVLGAFAYTTDIESVTIPNSVTDLWKFTFINSSVESVTLSPDCRYYDYTFPENCNLDYYDFDIIINDGYSITFTVGDDPEEVMIGKVKIKVWNEEHDNYIVRDLRKFTLENVDTSSVCTDETGNVIFFYDGDQSLSEHTFTYSVVETEQ